MSALREAVSQRDAGGVERAAHSLKGCVGNFAALGAIEAAAALENLGRAGDLAGAEHAYALLEVEIERLKPALKSLETVPQ
jgi:HPt (histidine-containing phosphotransfer) domain-containing protein